MPTNSNGGYMKKKKEESFNMNEVRHLAANFAITCEKGYRDSFDSWYSGISKDWRKIANRKEEKKEELYIVRLFDMFDGWIDISEALPEKEAEKIFNEHTKNGTYKTRYEHGDYYAIFPSDTKMLVTPERLGR